MPALTGPGWLLDRPPAHHTVCALDHLIAAQMPPAGFFLNDSTTPISGLFAASSRREDSSPFATKWAAPQS